MKRPDQYAKKILLTIFGKSFQVITETLYELVLQCTPAFVPDPDYLEMQGDMPEQKKWFLPRKSKVKKSIETVLGKRAAKLFLIQTMERDGKVAYAVDVPVESIMVVQQ